MKKYQPINCGVYDQLLVWTSQKIEVSVTYQKDDNLEFDKGIIADVYTKDKAEYLKLESGIEIRLDYLITINDIDLPSLSNCSL